MFAAPYDILMSSVTDPPDGTVQHISATSPEQMWFYISAPILLSIPAIFVTIRAYTKICFVRKYDWADFMIVAAYLNFVVNVSMARIQLSYGVGAHIWNLRYYDYMRMLFWMNIGEAVWCPCVFFIKTAIVLQYLTIFCPTRTLNRFVFFGGWSIIVAMFLFYFINIFLTLFICNPREKIWNDLVQGTCMNYNYLGVASAILNIASDFAILLLPVRSLWQLRITRKKKLIIFMLFATGLLATFASAMRIYYIMRLYRQGNKPDTSYEIAWMGLWSWAEIALGIICACSITLPKIWVQKRNEMRGALLKVKNHFAPIRVTFLGLVSKSSRNSPKSPTGQSTSLAGSYRERNAPLELSIIPTHIDDAGNLIRRGDDTQV